MGIQTEKIGDGNDGGIKIDGNFEKSADEQGDQKNDIQPLQKFHHVNFLDGGQKREGRVLHGRHPQGAQVDGRGEGNAQAAEYEGAYPDHPSPFPAVQIREDKGEDDRLPERHVEDFREGGFQDGKESVLQKGFQLMKVNGIGKKQKDDPENGDQVQKKNIELPRSCDDLDAVFCRIHDDDDHQGVDDEQRGFRIKGGKQKFAENPQVPCGGVQKIENVNVGDDPSGQFSGDTLNIG